MKKKILLSLLLIAMLMLTDIGVAFSVGNTTYPSMVYAYTGSINLRQHNQDGILVAKNESIRYAVLNITSQTSDSIDSAVLSLWRYGENITQAAWLVIPLWGYVGSNSTRSSPYPYLTLIGGNATGYASTKFRVKLDSTTKLPRFLYGYLSVIIPGSNVTQDRWAYGTVKLLKM